MFCSFDKEDERYYFAVAQPYSLSRYNMYMKTTLENEFDFLRVEKIGQTIQERPLELLTLTDPINLDPVGFIRSMLALLFRAHSLEGTLKSSIYVKMKVACIESASWTEWSYLVDQADMNPRDNLTQSHKHASSRELANAFWTFSSALLSSTLLSRYNLEKNENDPSEWRPN